MVAYLGLSSEPAQVQSISADLVMLKTDRYYVPGLRLSVELVNSGRTFKCILSLRVDEVQPDPEGGYTLDAAFCRSLSDAELRNLAID
jgi:hypothetical protein